MRTPVPLPAIIGPTAVGKTDFSLMLAEALGGEIISVDSRQIYRYLDVGTDKVSAQVRRRVIHHCIDVADPDEVFSVADFVRSANGAIERITNRGRVPILVGGTPFYFKALEGGLLSDLPTDRAIRRRIEEEMSVKGRLAMHRELMEVDPESARRIDPNDAHRIARALEIYRQSGKPPTWWYRNSPPAGGGIRMFYVGLTRPRGELYDRIAQRVRIQFSSGYPEEVMWLLENGFPEHMPSMQGFGYRELVAWAKGEVTLEEAMELDVRRTKAFSRRQMTWFRRFSPCEWYDLSEMEVSQVLESVIRRLEELWEGSE